MTKLGPDLELPAEMRVLAEKNVAQARQAFETLFENAREMVGKGEGQLEEVRSGIQELRGKAIGLMEANVEASFDFLTKLTTAKSPQEMMALQAQFLSEQLKTVAEQAKNLGADAKALGESAARSLGEHAQTLAERLKDLTAAAAQSAQTAAQDLKTLSETAARDVQAGAEQTFDPNRSN